MKGHGGKILGFLSAFCLGAMGGIWAQAFLLPFLASHAAFADWGFVKEWAARTTVIQQVQELVITQEQVFERVVERTNSIPVGVQSFGVAGTTSGSGFIATSDGLILTLATVVPQGNRVLVSTRETEEPFEAQVLKRDFRNNLALVKVEERNLPTAGFADRSSVKQGIELVLVGNVVEGGELVLLVNQGGVRAVSENQIRTNIFEKGTLGGSPLFDVEGRIVGMATIEPAGRIVAIPASVLRDFSSL